MPIMDLKIIFLLLIMLAFFSANTAALTLNISYGASSSETLTIVIAPIIKFAFFDDAPPIVGTIFLEDFIVTENNFIDGTGTIHALVYDGSGIASCEYKYNAVWHAGNYDGIYCTSNNIEILDGVTYNFNIRGFDPIGNVGYGTERTFYGKSALVDPKEVSDEDLLNATGLFVANLATGLAWVALFIILAILCVYLAKRIRAGL